MTKIFSCAKRFILDCSCLISAISLSLLFLSFTPAYAENELTCMNRCILTHPQWGQPFCSEGAEYYLVGEGCYEIQNDCFLSCNVNWNDPLPERYIPQPGQLSNQWRQEKSCSPELTKIPLELLPGDHTIDPRWSGRCECLDGKLIIAQCGHKKASCNEVCDKGFEF
ncbi:MAG: hypothetical protein HQM13_07005 [SAR324 cluster bacterium]|nr:hypothetical protein [SAR324 cluster bacterium]